MKPKSHGKLRSAKEHHAAAHDGSRTGDILDSLGILDPASDRRTPEGIAREALEHGYEAFKKKLQAIK